MTAPSDVRSPSWPVATEQDGAITGIVLSGGGARGAYEAGVLSGLIEVLNRKHPQTVAPFQVFCGTSVGAINVTWLAAHADRADLEIEGLLNQWRSLDFDKHTRLNTRGLMGLGWNALRAASFRKPSPQDAERFAEWSILNARALEQLVIEHLPWARLHKNIKQGLVHALVVAALNVATGRTTLFAELGPKGRFVSSEDPRRVTIEGPITADHILASAAIPLFFPARRVGAHYYCDGGLRFNTPIASAIRSGAKRLIVISLLYESATPAQPLAAQRLAAYPSPVFLLGKILNALLLDPVKYDLQVLDRFNRLLETLERTLDPVHMGEVRRVLTHTRGMPYRILNTLVFRPSQDIGRMASERVEELRSKQVASWLLANTSRLGTIWEADLLSFILFDREFAARLISLGRHDALAREHEILAFFS